MINTFMTGAIGYPLLELAYRKRTHYSMAIAGGLAACMIRRVGATNYNPATQAALCGLGITGIEWLCGMIWNRHHQVWDYRHVPLNYRGQICLPYTLLWCGLSACVLPLLER